MGYSSPSTSPSPSFLGELSDDASRVIGSHSALLLGRGEHTVSSGEKEIPFRRGFECVMRTTIDWVPPLGQALYTLISFKHSNNIVSLTPLYR